MKILKLRNEKSEKVKYVQKINLEHNKMMEEFKSQQ